ncbi:GCN5-related N-acetyltransferase (GNAT) domain-containing protein [Pochonia chlamydosporia 170]|uniref:GCN5-related N-acetyltransferase (GNAT) domain-containing protein n=1 Tax=Pochonia chlamydosporia 170 TaxID=1380566 RepID=A0A179FDR7_METCM|nr:GCN5-related N-acetyltransferase (GNAT) domain-containing protein [Pochonia chlamydosporia 170]OAQ63213.1 GCN5-related N-acetyltransferase (GNAT) domain-containing protein [Pochonia chlamydosporia 170]
MAQQGIVLPFNPKQHSHLTPYLAAIHASCITQDRTIATFLPPLSHEKLLSWWKERIAEVNDGKRQIWILVTQVDESGRPKGPELMGVVMLTTPYSETGAYRGYVEKLLVHKNFRGRGGARALMAALESEATRMSKNILLLDTETGSAAEAVYRKLGYVELGRVPGYGMSPAGAMKDGTFFYKQLG